MYMGQMNLNVTPDFERQLSRLMRLRRLPSKSEAIRVAVREAVERETRAGRETRFSAWLGLAKQGRANPRPRFAGHDDLWR
jgi:Arc/MetJ-type ribon-helix-helix transcriptional regulator